MRVSAAAAAIFSAALALAHLQPVASQGYYATNRGGYYIYACASFFCFAGRGEGGAQRVNSDPSALSLCASGPPV